MQKELAARAVVVRVVDYGEADRVLTLLTREEGKVSALARGARRSQKRFGPSLGLFSIGRARLRERPGAQLLLLSGWEPERAHIELSTNVAKMAHAGYVCEVARELSAPRHADPDAFDLLAETLAVLCEPEEVARVETLRVFELKLLDAVGLGPLLDRCASCGLEALGQDGQRFDVSRGGVVCGGCQGVGPELPEPARKALLRARMLSPARASELELDTAQNGACRDALLAAIHHQLGRPLRSVEFIAKVQQG
jgi:DNA repair protein RecO (recombination protein O)